MPAAPPPTASRYYATSALAATAAARAATAARPRGFRALWQVVARFQIAQAVLAAHAMDAMLADQDIKAPVLASVNPIGFATSSDVFEAMLADIERDTAAMLDQIERDAKDEERRIARLVESLVTDAGRAAQSVAVTSKPRVNYVRHLNLPSCSRCAVLAGREYRYSTGFQRHPGCDCVMIPVTVASPDLTHDPVELARNGQVTGLSKADRRALDDGADFGQVVNIRSRKAGLMESGRVLSRAGRPSPEAIYRMAPNDREEAVRLLRAAGYLR
jgi:hypothetical protein